MTLSETARHRLADIVELQPTKNKELQRRWEMESGSEVHQYLESELKQYYYRDEDSLIRATPEAETLITGATTTTPIEVSELQWRVLQVLPGPDDRSDSVVSVLHAVREAFDGDPGTDAVRSALWRLVDRGLVEAITRTVPTFRLALERANLHVDVVDPEASETTADATD